MYATYSPEVASAMLDETAEFFAGLLQGPQATGKMEGLFTSNTSYLNAGLAKLYGVANVTGDNLRPVQLPGERGGGILTQGSFLAAHAEGDTSHPIKRGIRIIRNILCRNLEPPSTITIPPVKDRVPGQTTRRRFEESTMGGAVCDGCHTIINPMGFAFEQYDAVGGFRTMEEGMPVDPTGVVPLGGGTVTIKTAADLTRALSTSSEARDCMTRQFLHYVLRRPEVKEEDGSIAALADAFKKNNYDLRDLIVATTRAHAFTHRQPLPGEGQK
jgi:hypothetical protein